MGACMASARFFAPLAALLLLALALPGPASAVNLCVVRNPGTPQCVLDAGATSGGQLTGVRITEWTSIRMCNDVMCTPWIVVCVGVGVWVDGRQMYDTGSTVCDLVP